MGLSFDYLVDQEARNRKIVMFIADKHYFITNDGQILTDPNDPACARQLIAKGDEMTEAQARKYGLIKDPEPAPEPEPVLQLDLKAVSSAPANKAVTPGAQKIENK